MKKFFDNLPVFSQIILVIIGGFLAFLIVPTIVTFANNYKYISNKTEYIEETKSVTVGKAGTFNELETKKIKITLQDKITTEFTLMFIAELVIFLSVMILVYFYELITTDKRPSNFFIKIFDLITPILRIR